MARTRQPKPRAPETVEGLQVQEPAPEPEEKQDEDLESEEGDEPASSRQQPPSPVLEVDDESSDDDGFPPRTGVGFSPPRPLFIDTIAEQDRARKEGEVRTVLGICGAKHQQIQAIMDEGFDKLSDFTIIPISQVSNMTTNITRLGAEKGGARIGAILTQKLKALISWCQEQHRQGKELRADNFSEEVLTEMLARLPEDAEDDKKAEKPTGFKPVKWVSWSKKLENYLAQIQGRNDVPLAYVIRKKRDPAQEYTDKEEERLYETLLAGPKFKQDNTKVFQILTELLTETPAWSWISRYEKSKDGRKAMQALRDHYDGPAQVEKRLSYAYNLIKSTHYRSEKVFTFEAYITRLNEAFDILAENGVGKHEREKVDALLRNIQSDNQLVLSAKTNILMHPEMRTSFQEAADRLSELIGATLQEPAAAMNRRKIAQVHAGPKKRHKGGQYCNGVDISDPKRNFSRDEWGKLTPEIRKQLQDRRKELRGGAAQGCCGRQGPTPDSRSIGGVTKTPNNSHWEWIKLWVGSLLSTLKAGRWSTIGTANNFGIG